MSQVVNAQTFQERMVERLKDNIGELMTDEEAKQLVDRAINQIFFQERPSTSSHYNAPKRPPFIHELLADSLQPIVERQIKAWIDEHQEEVLATIQRVVQEGLGTAMVKSLNNIFQNQMFAFESNIRQQITQPR